MQVNLKNMNSVKIMIIEPQNSVRQMLTDAIRAKGANSIISVNSCQDAMHFLEVERVDWIITSLLPEDEVNALQLLKLITVTPLLKGIPTSLLIDPAQEDYCLLLAFELGLLSYHRKSYVLETITQEFEALFNLLQVYNGNSTLTSAEYLRTFLDAKKFHKSRLALEQNLLAMYPGSTRILYCLAEAEFVNSQTKKACSILAQIELLDPKMQQHCKRLASRFIGDEDYKKERGNDIENSLGISNAVIIDPDTDVLNYGKELLTGVGVNKIETFENGKDAIEWLSSSREPDLIVMEWRIPQLTGSVLVQRIRQLGYIQVPIIVISSLIKREEDFHILKEMGVDECLEKPFDHSQFYSTVIWTIQQNRRPTEEKSLQLKIQRLLKAQKTSEAERLMSQFFADPRFDEQSKLEIEAQYEFEKGNYSKVQSIGMQALKIGGDSLALLNLLGKTMLKLKQFEGAITCFEKANQISSLNIERLLNTAEAHINLNKTDDARNVIEHAKTLDATNQQVKQQDAQIHLEQGNVDEAKEVMSQLESGESIIAYMNNRAVSLTRTGKFEEGIELYKRTIPSMPALWKKLIATVKYNLALAYARYGELESAVNTLSEIQSAFDRSLSSKCSSLRKRLEQSIATGARLELFEQSAIALNPSGHKKTSVTHSSRRAIPEEGEINIRDIISHIAAKRGDICCYLVFRCLEGIDPKALSLVETVPHFKERAVFEREETFKAYEKKSS